MVIPKPSIAKKSRVLRTAPPKKVIQQKPRPAKAKKARIQVKKPAPIKLSGKLNIAQKIINDHLFDGELITGSEIAIEIDQTLTQDSLGTMAYLQFEAMSIPRVKTKLSVNYIDHNTLQTGYENADDHKYLQTVAGRHGVYFSKAGNGCSHQIHIENFAVPGQTMLGTDSHACMSGALGMLAISAGSLDVALGMSGQPYYMIMPKVKNIVLNGKLGANVSAKDISLELLRRLTVRGGAGQILEFSGDGLKYLDLPARATIAHMAVELGAVTAIFPSDEITQAYLKTQKRGKTFKSLSADKTCKYDEQLVLNLARLDPLIAQPDSPDNVILARKARNTEINQVLIGTSGNGSYEDLSKVAEILKGNSVHENVSLAIVPASKQVLENLARDGYLTDLIHAGARILEPSNSVTMGIGQVPGSGQVSLRTTHRNSSGLSGCKTAKVYLCSPQTAALSAVKGTIADPRSLKKAIKGGQLKTPVQDGSLLIAPPRYGVKVQVVRGPNIKPIPSSDMMPEEMRSSVLLRLGDNFSIEQILPQGAQYQLMRSNIPALSRYLFRGVDPQFIQHARQAGGGFLVGGENYGQGASGENAAMALMYLKTKAVLAKSFSRQHRASLINFGILPLTFVDPGSYENIKQGDVLEIPFAKHMLLKNQPLVVKNATKHRDYNVEHGLSNRQIEIIIAGGLLNYIRQSQK